MSAVIATCAEPDGVEVVQRHEDAVSLPHPPLLVLDSVAAFLDTHDLGEGPVEWQRIGDGQSNVTYLLRRGGIEMVLRRGPRPPLPRSAHDMVREARIQQLLRPEGVPVPEILAVCEDESVLGVPFYLMEALDGEVLTDRVPDALNASVERAATCRALVDTLLRLHAIDVAGGELARLGRPEGYLERQVRRFAGLWEVNSRRSLPEVGALAGWLGSRVPRTQGTALVHGDYRLGNLMLHRNAPARVLAVLDWEMATLGDPLADLGYLTASWSEPGVAATPLHLTPVTAGRGYVASAELAERYAAGTGLDLTPLPWYQALALWKAAIFCEAMYTRWLAGERPGDDYAAGLGSGVPLLLERAQAYADLASR
ncbi:phosphotransferase family protein [Nocardioides sp. NPDC058538]|uniref:phosphotransferase family protein n=1 Tax=Nocardioides sp. NPDC058538 TaxID=3346542 RepID=UPI00364F81FF